MKPSNRPVVRFAPSPTGKVHIGNIRTCLFNYLFAKKHNGIFLVRVEDTDSKRTDKKAIKYIQDTLDWLGITPDAAPWIPGSDKDYGDLTQSNRTDIYQSYVKQLIDSGHAYYAFDTDDDLAYHRKTIKHFSYNYFTRMNNMKNSFTLSSDDVQTRLNNGDAYVIRFNSPRNTDVTYKDSIRGSIKVKSNTLDDKVLMKSDGTPTYHLANVVDDHLMNITHVIRGDDWLASTPLHVLLYDAFDWTAPKFTHCPMMLGNDGKPFSKRHGDTAVLSYRDKGYLASAFLNAIVLVGWNPGNDIDIMSLTDMITYFSLDRINKAGGKFNMDKLDNYQGHYLRLLPDDVLRSHLNVTDDYSDSDISKIIGMSKLRAIFFKDLNTIGDIFFKDVTDYTDDSKFTPDYKAVFGIFVDSYTPDITDTKQFIYDITVTIGVKFGSIMPGLRQALTGGISGPDLMNTIDILGYDKTIQRIKNTIV